MTKRAAIYARVSTDDQRSNYSITTQIAACLKQAAARGYTVVGDRYVNPDTGQDCPAWPGAVRAYVDDYTSLERFRPSLDAAVAFAERQGLDVLLVHALDRLARDPYTRQTLEREFALYGAKVEFVLGDYTETAEGEVRKDLDATFAKWENAKRVERSNRGKRGKAQRGLFVAGRTPYGYEADPAMPGGLRIVYEQAEVVRLIFELYVNQEYSIRGIATRLTDQQVPTSLSKSRWGKSAVQRILANETYAGVCYYNKYKRNGKRLIERERAEWIPIPVTPIIDGELWAAAQGKLADSRSSRRCEPKRFYLLSGMVFCAHCGRAYVAQAALPDHSRRKAEYRSYRHRVKESHCVNHATSAHSLESKVWHDIIAVINDPERAQQGYADAKAQYEALTRRQREHLATLNANLAKSQASRERLQRMYRDPDFEMTKTQYLQQKGEIDAEQADLVRRIAAEQAELDQLPAPIDLATFEIFSAEIRRAIADKVDPSPAMRRRLLQILHVKVFVSREEMPEVTGWFNSGLSSTAS